MNDSEYAKIVLPAKLEITRMMPAPPDRVWEYLVDPDLRQKWFCAGETGAAPGEPFVMDFDHSRLCDSDPPDDGCGDPQIMRGTIVAFEPPRLLAYDWPGFDKEADTRVTIELVPEGDQTRLHLVHERLGNLDLQRGASAGWHAHLDLLADVLEGVQPRDFWMHYGALKAEYDERIVAS